ncbi:Fe-dependent oxidoreductase, alcohol dehydrogenase [Opitutaceae bacterium TAV1]|nr:Fe-dependent oxidoreductase, alcohol dehydrogenase [Opitutaceae bacterium TAV1]
MQNFTFRNPVRIHFGSGMIARLADEIPADATVLLVYGGGSIRRNGVYDQIVAALGPLQCVDFAGIEPNPHYTTCLRAIDESRVHKVTHVVAAGGGSVIDAAKFIAAGACLTPGEDPWDFVNGRPVARALPLGAIVTLAASGSEYNCTSVITHDILKEKRVFFAPAVFPAFSILDPDTTASLPLRQRINGIVDPWMHVIEQYLTFPADAAVQDRISEALLLTLLHEGPRSLRDPSDAAARANLMWAASLALNGLAGAGVPQDWSTHLIGHELTMLHGLDHAQSLAVVHPALLAWSGGRKRQKLLQFGERVFGIGPTTGTEDERAAATIAAERDFFESLGAPTRLSTYGVREEHIPAITASLARVISAMGLKGLGEHQDIGPGEAAAILRQAL